MELKFKSSAAERVTFLTSYSKEISNKIMPRWIREVLSAALWAVVAFVVYQVTYDPKQTVQILMSVLAITWLWQKGIALLKRKMTARYISSFPNSDVNICVIDEERFTTESRGFRHSFPLTSLSRSYEEREGLYFDFPSLGRVRIPFSAFESPIERSEFVRKVNELKTPNQSTDPTLSSGTTGAGHQPRHP
jgi:hypothetical protein